MALNANHGSFTATEMLVPLLRGRVVQVRLALRPALRIALAFAFYLFVVAVILAYLEVQIEGAHGWASSLPTWRTTDPRVTWIFGGRPVTGYHVALNLLLLAFFHWPMLFAKWDLTREARVLSAFALLAVIWDFLWFVINPHFGLARYHDENIWWFTNWFLGFPVDYYVGLAAAPLLRLVPTVFKREPFGNALLEGITVILGALLLVALFVFLFQAIARG